jgi:hypothetical protein
MKTELLQRVRDAKNFKEGMTLRQALQHFLQRAAELRSQATQGKQNELLLLRQRVMELSEANAALYQYMNWKWVGQGEPMDMDEATPEEIATEKARIGRRIFGNLLGNAIAGKDPAELMQSRRDAANEFTHTEREVEEYRDLLAEIDQALALAAARPRDDWRAARPGFPYRAAPIMGTGRNP